MPSCSLALYAAAFVLAAAAVGLVGAETGGTSLTDLLAQGMGRDR